MGSQLWMRNDSVSVCIALTFELGFETRPLLSCSIACLCLRVSFHFVLKDE